MSSKGNKKDEKRAMKLAIASGIISLITAIVELLKVILE